jgi:hypothetical protein
MRLTNENGGIEAMLAMSDINIEQFFSVFANTGVPVAFLVPTPTGYGKSIMDATGSVRELFKNTHLHDYEKQGQGPDAKVLIESYFVYADKTRETCASLYRPVTKKGDPRIWFKDLKTYCSPCNLLALIIIEKRIFVLNLSDPSISKSLKEHGYVYDILLEAVHKERLIAEELKCKIQEIHNQGFIPSITTGDPGVGDTLENALGIQRNNSELPDYKGIELKASRLSRKTSSGTKVTKDRVNLFSKVPDEGLKYSEIVRSYGRWIWNESKGEERLSIQNTTFATKANSFGLIIDVDTASEHVNICYENERRKRRLLSYWYLSTLKNKLLEKHHETFWVKAVSEMRDGREWFRYDTILHTKNPNASLILPLIEADKIMIDFAGYFRKVEKNGIETLKWRDHGMLFKMWPQDLPLILGDPIIYDLTSE